MNRSTRSGVFEVEAILARARLRQPLCVMLAVVSDIHGNLEALDAVLADARANGVSDIYCLGDIIGYGPDPIACIERAMS